MSGKKWEGRGVPSSGSIPDFAFELAMAAKKVVEIELAGNALTPEKIRVASEPGRARKPPGRGEAPSGFARGAGSEWPSPF
jgi:hypothetical protein